MVSGAGLTLALVGEALRKAAILTARGNFTHLVCVMRVKWLHNPEQLSLPGL